jgi:hypothetical protein
MALVAVRRRTRLRCALHSVSFERYVGADMNNIILTDLVPLRRHVTKQGAQRQTEEQSADSGEDT